MKMLKTMLMALVILVWVALGSMMLVMTFDPECGPDGYSQTACMKEFANDMAALVTGGAR